MEHTKGPWKIYDFDQINDYAVSIRAVSADRIVAEAVTEDSVKPTKEEVANARLIAAAPELLEAAALAAEEIALLQDALPQGYSIVLGHSAKVVEILEKAIAKAKGEK